MKARLIIRNFIGSKILKNSILLNKFYNKFYVWKNKDRFLREVDKRKNLSIFDYVELSRELPFCPLEFVKDSNFYGYASNIKKYAGVDDLNCSIEHGLYNLDGYLPSATFSRTIKKVITFSKIREKLIKERVGKPTLAVGPYVHYVDSLLTFSEIKEIKESYGKILLFFPSHSDVEHKLKSNVNDIINKLLYFKEKFHFDSVFVNMFYYDILYSDYADEYRKAGFQITTAGHRYDVNFISRLKSIIELSDMTISNGFGTNIGFSIYLNKPFVYIGNRELLNIGSMISEVLSSFMDESEYISEKQRQVVAKYWGFDCIKTPDQIRSFVQN